MTFETEASGERLFYKNITEEVSEIVARSGLGRGLVNIFVEGSTGALISMEDEPGLREDLARALDRLVPAGLPYRHEEAWHDGNGHSHVRASLLGPSITLPFNESGLGLGTWQQLLFVELDVRDRRRQIRIQIIGE